MNWFLIIGCCGSICLVLGYLPQAIQTIRTRNTDGISLPAFLMMAVGGMFFAVQGLLSDPINWPLFTTNTITTVSSLIVFSIKMYNDFFRKKE